MQRCHQCLREGGEWAQALDCGQHGKEQHSDGRHHMQRCHRCLRDRCCTDAGTGCVEPHARSSIQMDTVTCNAAVSACEKGGEWAQALDASGQHGKAPRSDEHRLMRRCDQCARKVVRRRRHSMFLCTMARSGIQMNTKSCKAISLPVIVLNLVVPALRCVFAYACYSDRQRDRRCRRDRAGRGFEEQRELAEVGFLL